MSEMKKFKIGQKYTFVDWFCNNVYLKGLHYENFFLTIYFFPCLSQKGDKDKRSYGKS